MAKPQVRDVWSLQMVADPQPSSSAGKLLPRDVSAIAVTAHPNRSFKYLAVALTDGTVSVWTYDLAVTTNRISATTGGGSAMNEMSQKLLQPLCRLEGSSALEASERTLPIMNFDGTQVPEQDNEAVSAKSTPTYCTHLSWLPPNPASSSLLLLVAAFLDGAAVYHVSLPLIMDVRPISTDSISELSVTSDGDPGFAVQSKKTRGKGDKKTLTSRISSLEKKQVLLMQTSLLSPFAAAKVFKGALTEKGHAAWLDLGPRCPPFIVLAFNATSEGAPFSTSTHVLLCAVDLPLYGSPETLSPVSGLRPLRALCSGTLSKPVADVTAISSVSTIICHRNGELVALSPSLSWSKTIHNRDGELQPSRRGAPPLADDKYFSSLCRPVGSAALGLDSTGSIVNDYGDTLHVFSVLQCNRRKLRNLPTPHNKSGGSGKGTGDQLDWGIPVLRHWLCRTTMGDRGATRSRGETTGAIDGLSASQFGDEVVTGGADGDVVCELTCGDSSSAVLVPHRIVREPLPMGRLCVVLFISPLGSAKRDTCDGDDDMLKGSVNVSPDPIAFAIIDTSTEARGQGKNETFQLHHGRDIFFFTSYTKDAPCGEGKKSSVVVLNANGRSVRQLVWSNKVVSDADDKMDKNVKDGSYGWHDCGVVPIFQDGDPETSMLGIRRILPMSAKVAELSSNGMRIDRILFIAMRQIDGRECLLLGRRLKIPQSNTSDTGLSLPKLMPRERGRGPRLWLHAGEEAISIVQLPSDVTGRTCLSVATQRRVLLISAASLNILAEILVKPTCGALAPLGPCCVAFSSASTPNGGGDAKIRYLSCLRARSPSSRGIIATIPCPRFGYAPYLFFGLHPDRLLYLAAHCGTRLVEHGADRDVFLMPLAITRPAFPLEPLIASALCCDNDAKGVADLADDIGTQELLRCIIEKFGRKTNPFPHAEGEGIGTQGETLLLP